MRFCKACSNVSITCLLVCSPHSAWLWDALKSACKNVICKRSFEGCFPKPVVSCAGVPPHLSLPSWVYLPFFSSCLHSLHDLEVFNQVLCCLPYCDLKKPYTYPPTSNHLRTNCICHCRKCRNSYYNISKPGMKVFVQMPVQGGRVPPL